MNLYQALEQLRAGRTVRSASVVDQGIKFMDGVLVFADTEEDVVMDNELLSATDYEVVQPSLEELNDNQAYMFFDDEKDRWISTTKPQKHLEEGHRVAVFSISSEL